MSKNKLIIPVLAVALLAGAGAGIAGIASAQSTSTTAQSGATAARGKRPQMGPHIDGNVTALSGTTITLTEEANEGSTVYAVDASKATVMKAGAASELSAVAVGDKIFVQGTQNGSNVTATAIDDGRPQGGSRPGRGPGIMGTLSAVNNTTLTVTGKDGKTYTVDASSAKLLKNSGSATAPTTVVVSDLKVGDTVMVQGTVTGTSVAATSVFDGQFRMGRHGFGRGR